MANNFGLGYETAKEIPVAAQLQQIRIKLRDEAENRTVDDKGRKLYDCISQRIRVFISDSNRTNVLTTDLQIFASPSGLQRKIILLLKDHKNTLKSVLPLLVEGYPLTEVPDCDSERKEYNKLVEKFYSKMESECSDGDYYQAYWKLCLYAAATCINVKIFVYSIDQQWMFFEPLFEFEGQPQCVLRYITMFMSTDKLFYLIQSNDRDARPPKSKGLVGVCLNCLDDTPTESIGVPEELRDIPMVSKEKLCGSVSIELLIESCDVLRKTGLLSSEDHYKFADSHRGIRKDYCRKMAESQDAFDALCKVLIKRRDKKTLSSYIQNWDDFVPSSKYLSQFEALLVLDSAILDRNISVDAFLNKCRTGKAELNETRRKVTTTVIASSSVGVVSAGLVIAGIVLAPVSFGASLGLSIAGGAIGVGTGVAAGTARVVEGVKQNKKLQDIKTEQAVIKAKEENVIAALQTVENLFQKPCANALGSVEQGPGMSLRGFLAVGSVLRSAHSVAAIALAAVRLGTTAAAISAAVLGPLSLVFDIAFLAEAAHNKRTGDTCNAGDMLQSMTETVDIKSKIFNNMLRGDTDNQQRSLDWS